MNLAAVNLERLPDNQLVAGDARGTGAKIQTKEYDAEVFVHGRDAIGGGRQRGNLLHFDVFAAWQKGAARPGHQASVLKAIRISGKWGLYLDETAGFETCRVQLGGLDRILASVPLRCMGTNRLRLAGTLQCR